MLTPWATNQNRVRWDDHGTNVYSSWQNNNYNYAPTLPVNKIQWRVQATEGLSYENTYVIWFGYKPTPQAVTPIRIQAYKLVNDEYIYEELACGQWAYNENDYNLVKCSFTPKQNYSSNEYLRIELNLTQAYLNNIRPYMYGFEERKGTNAVITEIGNQIVNAIENIDITIEDITHEYETEDITNQVEQEQTKQEQILESLDDSYIESLEWRDIGNILTENRGEWLMNKLTMSSQIHMKIYTMIITVLGLGIIKMVLGR